MILGHFVFKHHDESVLAIWVRQRIVYTPKTNLIVIPFIYKSPKESAAAKKYCFQNGECSTTIGLSLGGNSPPTFEAFNHYLSSLRAQTNQSVFILPNNPPAKQIGGENIAKRQVQNCTSVDTSKLRINIFQRVSGSALRAFTNLDEVVDLVREYTDRTVTFTTSEKHGFWEQYDLFNQFDVLISPHGSHLTNGLFIHNPHTSIIEVVASCYNEDFKVNLGKLAIHKMSIGHSPVLKNETLQKKALLDMAVCNNRTHCNFRISPSCDHSILTPLIQSDLFVNITILRQHLEESISAICTKMDSQ